LGKPSLTLVKILSRGKEGLAAKVPEVTSEPGFPSRHELRSRPSGLFLDLSLNLHSTSSKRVVQPITSVDTLTYHNIETWPLSPFSLPSPTIADIPAQTTTTSTLPTLTDTSTMPWVTPAVP
jgi:hypothetical protein